MSFWKTFGLVLGGAATGVVALVALPILAPVGAITLAGAAIGVVGGAAVGGATAAIADDDEEIDEARKEGKKEERNKAKAKYDKMVKDFEEKEKVFLKKFADAANKFKEYKQYEEFIVAMFAVAVGAAASDGEISEEEKAAINLLVNGEIGNKLPQHIKQYFESLYLEPPTFEKVCQYVSKYDKSEWIIFDGVIDAVLNADDDVNFKEKEFSVKWKQFYSAAA
jgi:hypothetical protein